VFQQVTFNGSVILADGLMDLAGLLVGQLKSVDGFSSASDRGFRLAVVNFSRWIGHQKRMT
jgi:hypothetical protein